MNVEVIMIKDCEPTLGKRQDGIENDGLSLIDKAGKLGFSKEELSELQRLYGAAAKDAK